MIYTQVDAKRNDDNVIHGAIYYGMTDDQKAISRFLEEFPEYSDVAWVITAKVYID